MRLRLKQTWFMATGPIVVPFMIVVHVVESIAHGTRQLMRLIKSGFNRYEAWCFDESKPNWRRK